MHFRISESCGSPAVIEKEITFSYNDLHRRVNELCAFYQSHGIAKVLIHLDQGFEAYAFIIAAFIAGVTFCSVNSDTPESRLLYYESLFEPDTIISVLNHQSAAGINSAAPQTIKSTQTLLEPQFLNPRGIAYVIFTSGSAGLPKGVKITRAGLLNFLQWSISEYAVSPGDIWGQYSNIGFDLSICDIFTATYSGAVLVPLKSHGEKMLPGPTIKNKQITFWHSVPSVIDLLNKAGQLNKQYLSSVKKMTFCGEKLYPAQLELLFAANTDLTIYNTYGPTEATVFCIAQKLTAANYRAYCDKTVALGEPIPGYELSLSDPADGTAGEITILSDFIGAGYLDNARASGYTTRMVAGRSQRAYITGDYAYKKNGCLYYEGRKDRQVKILGNRIDLSEIDSSLRRYGCAAAISTVVDQKIISFVIHSCYDETETRTFLKHWLPTAFMPHRIVPLHEFCYNSNQKIDIGLMVSNLQRNEYND